MGNMTRESLRELGITDDKIIDNILTLRGDEITQATENETKLRKELDDLAKKAKNVDDLTAKIKELEAKSMTAEELQAQKIKEAEMAQKKYQTLSNKVEAKNFLLNAGMTAGDTLDRILDKISSDNLENTLDGAKVVAEMFKATKESTEQSIKAELLKQNPKPDATNTMNDDIMTKEKFDTLNYEQMAEYAAKDPEGFAKM